MTELNITNALASERILAHCEAGTLVQNHWHGRGADGRDIACLLGAIDPKVTSSADCNGKLMPLWLAELTVVLFDGIARERAVPIARRYGMAVARWDTLSPAQWDSILTRMLIRCVDDAVAVARPVNEGKPYWPAVIAACEQVKAALASGDRSAASAARSAESAASAARSAARSAASAESAARSAESAARSAESAAWGAESAASAARSAASAARSAASAARSAARSAESTANAARSAASAAYLSLFSFVLDRIEEELGEVK